VVSSLYSYRSIAIETHLVPGDGRSEQTPVQHLELLGLVFRTLVVGLGDIKVSLSVGDTLYMNHCTQR
jgi:hypothetical protein